jgi:hypothetical protein
MNQVSQPEQHDPGKSSKATKQNDLGRFIIATARTANSLANAVKALLQVWLDGLGVTCLAEYLQELVIGQEVEPAGQKLHKQFYK